MSADPNTDTRSPWYECFEPHEQLALITAETRPPDAARSPADAAAAAPEPDWALEALFDYYNA